MSVPLRTQELNDLRNGEFVLDALHLELRKPSGTLAFSGPGQIRRSKGGRIEYTLYDTESFGAVSFNILPGSIVPEEDFLNLEVRDWRGRMWQGSRTRPDTSYDVRRKGVVCRGELDDITCIGESTRKTGESLWLFVLGDISILQVVLTTLQAIEGPYYTISIRGVEDGLEIDAHSRERCFPPEFASRIIESLWFVLGVVVNWTILGRHTVDGQNLTIRSAPTNLLNPRLGPPLEHLTVEALAHLNRIMIYYLEHISFFASPRYHPISVNIKEVLIASSLNVEAEALALGTALESFIRREFAELGAAESEFLQAVDSVVAHISLWDGEEVHKDRILKSLGYLKGSNPRTAMKRLVEMGVLTAKHVKAWNRIRHTTAHGLEFESSLQDVARYCHQTHDALVRLVLYVIGYSGPYTDRSGEIWDTSNFAR